MSAQLEQAKAQKLEAERQIKEAEAEAKQSEKQSILNNMTPGGGQIRRVAGYLMSLNEDLLKSALDVLSEVQKVK